MGPLRPLRAPKGELPIPRPHRGVGVPLRRRQGGAAVRPGGLRRGRFPLHGGLRRPAVGPAAGGPPGRLRPLRRAGGGRNRRPPKADRRARGGRLRGGHPPAGPPGPAALPAGLGQAVPWDLRRAHAGRRRPLHRGLPAAERPRPPDALSGGAHPHLLRQAPGDHHAPLHPLRLRPRHPGHPRPGGVGRGVEPYRQRDGRRQGHPRLDRRAGLVRRQHRHDRRVLPGHRPVERRRQRPPEPQGHDQPGHGRNPHL